jgi:ABC-type antimicrobial peptide transport system permease subunit
MDEVKTAAMLDERFQVTLLGAFAAFGLLLAAAGIYGLIAFSVAQRTREFGIRMALGATGGRLLASLLRQAAALAAAGVALGLLAAFFLTRLLQNFVWGVSTLDPITFATVPVVLCCVVAVATLVPALRAVRLNPVAALRQ